MNIYINNKIHVQIIVHINTSLIITYLFKNCCILMRKQRLYVIILLMNNYKIQGGISMDENKNIIKKTVFYCNKFFYSFYFPVLILILIYFVYKFLENNIYIICFLYIVIILFWITKLIYIPKNNSDKYGIIFLINNGDAYDENILSMFKKLKYSLEDDFNIFVYNNNFIRKINSKSKKEKVLNQKKYHMIINLYSLKGLENSESVCSLTNKDITFLTPELSKEIQNNLKKDFNNSFKKIIKLREKNSLYDISENADLMSLSIRYFVAIIYIIFNNLEKAEEELKKMDFSNLPVSDKIVQYLRKSYVVRYIDIYFIRIMKIIQKNEYLYDDEKFSLLCQEETKLIHLIESSNDNNNDIKYLNNDIRSKINFVNGDLYKSIMCLNQMIKRKPNDYAPKLSKAFIEINLQDIDGIKIYKKLAKRKDIDINIINGCIEFIEDAMKNKKIDSTYLLLSKGLLIYYWIDKEEGKQIINSIINNITNLDFQKYITIRF